MKRPELRVALYFRRFRTVSYQLKPYILDLFAFVMLGIGLAALGAVLCLVA